MIAFVVAVAKNNVIGKRGELPWYIPEDLKHFKQITSGHTVLMGRKTFDSIIQRLGKPLPNRKSLVITSRKMPHFENVEFFTSIEEAIKTHKEDIYVIGGATIFSQLMDKVDTLYMTHIVKEYEGDVFFPPLDLTKWKKISEEIYPSFSFVEYKKI
jgi:dihydrofolate reductase